MLFRVRQGRSIKLPPNHPRLRELGKHLQEGTQLSAPRDMPLETAREHERAGYLEFLGREDGDVGTSPIVTPTPPAPAAVAPGSKRKWDFDPDTLKGRPIEQLNALILGVDASEKPREKIEDAIALLTSNFVPKTVPQS